MNRKAMDIDIITIPSPISVQSKNTTEYTNSVVYPYCTGDLCKKNAVHFKPDAIISQCIRYIRIRANKTPGLFQSSCNMTIVKETLELMHSGHLASLSSIENPHVVANTLLYHLRELREPLMPFKLYNRIIEIGSDPKEETLIENLRDLIRDLPQQNRLDVEQIMHLLYDLSNKAVDGDTSAFSLAQIFSPVLCKHEDSAFMSLRHIGSFAQSRTVIQAMIEHYTELFKASVCTVFDHAVSPVKKESDIKILNSLVHFTVQPLFNKDSQKDTFNDIMNALKIDKNSKIIIDRASSFAKEMHFSGWLLFERRRMIHACRLLRKIINAYNGSKQNRNTLQNKLKQWKKLVREDAAKAIQGIIRKKLVKSKDPIIQSKALSFGLIIKNLEKEKRGIKVQLKQYDETFLKRNGILPDLKDKEPIRYLYERYRDIKFRIETLTLQERNG